MRLKSEVGLGLRFGLEVGLGLKAQVGSGVGIDRFDWKQWRRRGFFKWGIGVMT